MAACAPGSAGSRLGQSAECTALPPGPEQPVLDSVTRGIQGAGCPSLEGGGSETTALSLELWLQRQPETAFTQRALRSKQPAPPCPTPAPGRDHAALLLRRALLLCGMEPPSGGGERPES